METTVVPGGTGVRVDWPRLDAVPAAFAEIEAQTRDLTRFATTWVCRPDGFATSPVCVFRPVAALLGELAEQLASAGAALESRLADLGEGAAVSLSALRAGDAEAEAALTGLLAQLEGTR